MKAFQSVSSFQTRSTVIAWEGCAQSTMSASRFSSLPRISSGSSEIKRINRISPVHLKSSEDCYFSARQLSTPPPPTTPHALSSEKQPGLITSLTQCLCSRSRHTTPYAEVNTCLQKNGSTPRETRLYRLHATIGGSTHHPRDDNEWDLEESEPTRGCSGRCGVVRTCQCFIISHPPLTRACIDLISH